MNECKRISPTVVEVDGELYTKNYNTDFTFTDGIFAKVKTMKDGLALAVPTKKRLLQYTAFQELAAFADVINEGKVKDEKGFMYYVYYSEEHKEFFICEHTYSIRHTIYFASRKLAQYSIELCRESWYNFYGIKI